MIMIPDPEQPDYKWSKVEMVLAFAMIMFFVVAFDPQVAAWLAHYLNGVPLRRLNEPTPFG